MPEGLAIEAVAAGSPGARLGLQAGDRLLEMQGEPVRDLIDYLFFAGDPGLRLVVERNGQRLEMRTENYEQEDLGIQFAPGQQKLRTCANNCLFCFVDQMPPGFRETLYIKDDDWRSSFLHGSYITLTNLRDEDYGRIASRCVSPLFVSVHATDDDVRAQLLGTERGRGIMDALRRLIRGGTSFHAQAVIVGGVNDGEVLERTVRDLASLHPYALSLSLVPVGLTASRSGLPRLEPLSAKQAAAVLDMAERLQGEFLEALGTRFVFASDEFYLQAGRDLPPAEAYEDFCQLENGVGIAADFRDSAAAQMQCSGRARPGAYLLVTGLGIQKEARQLAGRLREQGIDIACAGVVNRTFGPAVNVSGLLTGTDVVSALAGKTEGRTLLLPEVMFRDGDGVTLDNMTPAQIGRQVGAECIVAPAAGGAFVRLLLEPEGTKEEHV